MDSKDHESSSIFYDCTITPSNAPEEGKTGVTIKGSNEEYIQAYTMIMDIFKRKGDRYVINGVEIAVNDNHHTKPYIIEVKQKTGRTGRANLKIFGVNKNGGGTIMISKSSGVDFVYAKVLALKVITYLLDGIITKSIKHDDIVRMKKNMSIRSSKGVKCDLCENSFVNMQGLRLHTTRMHNKSNTENKCNSSEKKEKEELELDSHTIETITRSDEEIETTEKMTVEEEEYDKLKDLEDESWEEKRLKNSIIETDEMEVDKKEENETESTFIKRAKLQDEKVLKKQREIEQEEKALKEKHDQKEKEKKRKRQLSTDKKKTKKKSRKDLKNKPVYEKPKSDANVREIENIYETKFSEVGLDISEYVLCVVKGDGACGSSCAALHFHSDQKLGPYVRRNINQHIADFFRFYEKFIEFPLSQRAGSEELPFKNKEEYLDFLQNDPRSAWLWMEHYDLQALSNIYQVSVHILTTGVKGIKAPSARWTHISPDQRLKDFSTDRGEVPDLWLMHQDENHFDLIAPKNSIIVEEQYQEKERNTENNEYERDEETEKKNEIDKVIVKDNEREDKTEGPGYMGWNIDDSNENAIFSTKVEDLKICFNQMKENFDQLKSDFKIMNDSLKKKEENEEKVLKKHSLEISKLKDDYKECVKYPQKENL